MTSRPASERLTPRERKAMLAAQGGRCACGCGTIIGVEQDGLGWVEIRPAEADHQIPNGLRRAKPDQLLYKPCHDAKTPADNRMVRKARRMARETGPQRIGRVKKKIPSRPFGGWLGFRGDVRRPQP